jgi:hypothetical protein
MPERDATVLVNPKPAVVRSAMGKPADCSAERFFLLTYLAPRADDAAHINAF